MANTNSKDLEEKLSVWAVKLEVQDAEHHARHSPRHSGTARDKLNEKLSTWAVKIPENEYRIRKHGKWRQTRTRSECLCEKLETPPSRRRTQSERMHTSAVELRGDKRAHEEERQSQMIEKLSQRGLRHDQTQGNPDAADVSITKRESVEFDYVTRKGLQRRLVNWGIETQTVEHPEVFTVQQALLHLSNIEGMFAKNLFLRDKKRKLYLFCAPHNTDITLKDLARLVGASGGLRFADSELLQEKLGLSEGAVTIFGLINDLFHDVSLILDRRLVDGTYSKILFHPMVNCATTAISPAGLKAFLNKTGRSPVLIDIPALKVLSNEM